MVFAPAFTVEYAPPVNMEAENSVLCFINSLRFIIFIVFVSFCNNFHRTSTNSNLTGPINPDSCKSSSFFHPFHVEKEYCPTPESGLSASTQSGQPFVSGTTISFLKSPIKRFTLREVQLFFRSRKFQLYSELFPVAIKFLKSDLSFLQ